MRNDELLHAIDIIETRPGQKQSLLQRVKVLLTILAKFQTDFSLFVSRAIKQMGTCILTRQLKKVLLLQLLKIFRKMFLSPSIK